MLQWHRCGVGCVTHRGQLRLREACPGCMPDGWEDWWSVLKSTFGGMCVGLLKTGVF